MRLQHLPLLFSISLLATANFIHVTPPTPGLSLGKILGPDILGSKLGFLDCANGGRAMRAICDAISARVQAALAAANLRIDSSGLLFTYDNPTAIKIPTGHACSATASIRHTRSQAVLLAPTSLDFFGNPLSASDPALFLAEIPVKVAAQVDVRQKFGQMLFGNCLYIGRDEYEVRGRLQTTASVAALFSIGPTHLKTNDKGDWVFTIRPMFKMAIELGSTDVKLDSVHGRSPFTGLVTALLGGISSLLKAVTQMCLLDVDRALVDLRVMASDVGVGVTMNLPLSLYRETVQKLALAYVEEKKGRVTSEFSADMEKKLREQLSKALGLDANGERTFVVRKEFIWVLNMFGAGADIFVKNDLPEDKEL